MNEKQRNDHKVLAFPGEGGIWVSEYLDEWAQSVFEEAVSFFLDFSVTFSRTYPTEAFFVSPVFQIFVLITLDFF